MQWLIELPEPDAAENWNYVGDIPDAHECWVGLDGGFHLRRLELDPDTRMYRLVESPDET
jgi:hypothetical protein